MVKNQLNVAKQDGSIILYNADMIAAPKNQLFDADYCANIQNQQYKSVLSSSKLSVQVGIGRAQVVYFDYENMKMVLKHYYRGGLLASIVKDKYLGFYPEKTRAFKEFRLLAKMQEMGLPVPVAIAARAEKGLFYFRVDLITKEIENVQTLADRLSGRLLVQEVWNNIGRCIRRFHNHNIYHADLNARNILLAEKDEIYLIDFDNSFFRQGSKKWKMSNLSRLKRSLLKFKKNESNFSFEESGWSSLMDGYNGY